MDIDAIETKLTAARAKLILDKPFLGALVLRLPLAAADPNWCATTATDARKFYYNEDFIDALSLDELRARLTEEPLREDLQKAVDLVQTKQTRNLHNLERAIEIGESIGITTAEQRSLLPDASIINDEPQMNLVPPSNEGADLQ